MQNNMQNVFYKKICFTGGLVLEQIEKMKEYLQEYFVSRVAVKRECLLENDVIVLEKSFKEVLKKLVDDQILKQIGDRKQVISAIFMCHLISSDYTGSYDSILGLCSPQIYLDEFGSSIYWRPPCLFDSIEKDMEEVKKYLYKSFVRIEEYEFLQIKLKLLHDNRELLKEIIPRLIHKNSEIIINSSLRMDDELLILHGVYMERLQVIGHVKANYG